MKRAVNAIQQSNLNKNKNQKCDNSTFKKINRSVAFAARFLLIPLAVACFALLPTAQAVTPAPDGGYSGHNTAEGDNALFNLDTSQGLGNTAIGLTRCIVTRPVPATPPTVIKRYIATPPATTTPPPVVWRSISTPPAPPTQPMVIKPSSITMPIKTRPTVFRSSLATRPAVITRLMVFRRSLITRRSGLMFFLATPLAAPTRPLVLVR